MIGPKFIGVMGAKGSGKDSVAGFIMELDARFRRVAFADVMKEMAVAIDPYVFMEPPDPAALETYARLSEVVAMFGWEAAKTQVDVRRFLQRLGTEGGRQCLGDSIWITTTWSRYVYPYIDAMDPDGRYESNARFVFSDVRFENEIATIRAVGGELWRIDRPEVEDGDPHPSERAWREEVPDLTIANDGTLEGLRAKVYGALLGGTSK